jgi:hypothetical protein
MTKASNTITVHAALDSCFTYAEKIATLQAAFKGKTAEAVRASILPDVASYPKYSVPLVAGSGKAEGTKVLDKEHAQYEACRKALGRLVSAIVGKASSGAKEEIEIPAEVLAAAEKLAKLCAKYEEARKLASTAVGQAFAK